MKSGGAIGLGVLGDAAPALGQNRQDFARRVVSYVAGHSGAMEETG